MLVVLLLQLQLVPQPAHHHLRDAAQVLSPAQEVELSTLLEAIHTRTKLDVGVATLPDLGTNTYMDAVAKMNGEWERTPDAVLLLIPKETAFDHRGRCYLALRHQYAANTAQVCQDMVPWLQRQQYDSALSFGISATSALVHARPAVDWFGGLWRGALVLGLLGAAGWVGWTKPPIRR